MRVEHVQRQNLIHSHPVIHKLYFPSRAFQNLSIFARKTPNPLSVNPDLQSFLARLSYLRSACSFIPIKG